MRYVFLIIGFVVVVALEGIGVLSKDNWSFYMAAAAVYVIFRGMKPTNKVGPLSSEHGAGGDVLLPTVEPPIVSADEAQPNQEAVESRKQEPVKRNRNVKTWLFVGSGLAVLAVVGTFMQQGGETGPQTANGVYLRKIEGLTVWDPQACTDASFPQFRDPQLMKLVGASLLGRMRIMSAQMFCSRPWDPSLFARAAKLLSDNGLLLTQWNRDTFEAAKALLPPGTSVDGEPTDAIYGSYSADIAAFFKVVDVSFLLLADERTYASMQAEFPNLPARDAVRHVVDQIGLDQTSTRSSIKGVVYNVSRAPSILLITDLGTETSLRWALEELKDGSLTKPGQAALAGLAAAGMSGAGSGAEGNFEAISVIGPLNQRLRLRTAMSEAHSLPDLQVFLFKDVATTTGLPIAYGRDAAFDPEHHRILANRSAAGEFTGATKQDLDARTQKLLTSPLDHEFTHYLTFRPELSGNAFVQEGEATVVGEDATKSTKLAFLLPAHDPLKQRLNDLMAEAQEGKDVAAAMQAMDASIEAEKNRRIPFSRMECSWLTTLQSDLAKRGGDLQVFSFFTWSPPILNAQPEPTVRLAYATAWAVYYYDRTSGKGWQSRLEHLAATSMQDGTLNETDKKFLDNIGSEVTAWVRKGSRRACVAGQR